MKSVAIALCLWVMFSVLMLMGMDALEFEETGACRDCSILPIVWAFTR